MDDPISKGFPFGVQDIWRQSSLWAKDTNETLFQRIPADVHELESGDTFKLPDLAFHIPELGLHKSNEDRKLEKIESEVASPATESISFDSQTFHIPEDPWTLDIDHEDREPLSIFHTWEAFQKKDVPNAERTAYLSEAGSRVVDLALTSLEKKATSGEVLPQNVMLRALYNLAVGRSSLFFQWDEAKGSFVQTLATVPVSGHSSVSSRSLIDNIVSLGSTYRHLSEFATNKAPAKNSCPAISALKGCIGRILDSIEEHITSSISRMRSILQLQRQSDAAHQLLQTLEKVTQCIENCCTDEDVISAISDYVHELVSADNRFSETFRLLLSTISAPWLERFCSDLGLASAEFPHSVGKAHEGREDGFSESHSSIEWQNSENEAFPKFVSDDDRALIKETKTSLKILRQYPPERDISSFTDANKGARLLDHGTLDTPSAGWSSFGFSKQQYSSMVSSGDSGADKINATVHNVEDFAWAEPGAQIEHLQALDARISQPINEWSADPLQEAVNHSLCSDIASAAKIIPLDGIVVDPLLRIRPSLQLHASIIKRTLHRHLFWKCRLLYHLDLQRQYHMLGNGDFLTRLAEALFSTDTQSAERKRGTIPTGKTMGLRLGSRDGQRWPPASSELRLTLMGVLTEICYPEVRRQGTVGRDKELPGGLSFSIRELPDQEIERVMDPGSIYALDFLRLQYTAPPCVDAVITASSLQVYDDIFRFLLRMLRVLHVTTRLQNEVLLNRLAISSGKSSPSLSMSYQWRFVVEAHHFVITLMSHIMDVGIEAPWQNFTSAMTEIKQSLDSEGDRTGLASRSLPGLDDLCELHKTCLETIRRRLFLRRKQEKIRLGIEDVLSAILKCASTLEEESSLSREANLSKFDQSMRAVLVALHAAVDKPAKSKEDSEMFEGDAEAMKLLMFRLNWNGFYSAAT